VAHGAFECAARCWVQSSSCSGDSLEALAYIQGHRCELISRNGHAFKSWPQLSEKIAHAVRCRSAVLDGEVCCLKPDGGSDFYSLLFRREWPHFYAFDVLFLNGRDLRGLPLLERKRRLRAIMPTVESRVLYLDHIEKRGCDLFRAVCSRDLEGIVGKYADGIYQSDGRSTSWVKIKNPAYTQMEGRHEVFEGKVADPRRSSGAKLPLALRLT
jgi:bifunctional non-homologous end joining protein LigD